MEMEEILRFLQKKLEELRNIQGSVNGENCFEKLAEYFKVCKDISRRKHSILNIQNEIIHALMPAFLDILPFCSADSANGRINPNMRSDKEKFLGCEEEKQVYEYYFEYEYGDVYIHTIFTFNDEPSMDTITVLHEYTHRTLSYLRNEEKDQDVIDTMMLFVYCFFRDQLIELEDLIFDYIVDISFVFSDLQEHYTLS